MSKDTQFKNVNTASAQPPIATSATRSILPLFTSPGSDFTAEHNTTENSYLCEQHQQKLRFRHSPAHKGMLYWMCTVCLYSPTCSETEYRKNSLPWWWTFSFHGHCCIAPELKAEPKRCPLIPSVTAPGRGQQRSPHCGPGRAPVRPLLAAPAGGLTPARSTPAPRGLPFPLPGSPFPPLPKVISHPGLPTLRSHNHRYPTDGAWKTGGPGEAGEASAARRPPRSPSSGRPQQQAHGRHGRDWHGGGAGKRGWSWAGAILGKGRASPPLPAPSTRHPQRRGKMAAARAIAALGRRLAGALRLSGARPGLVAAGLPGYVQGGGCWQGRAGGTGCGGSPG